MHGKLFAAATLISLLSTLVLGAPRGDLIQQVFTPPGFRLELVHHVDPETQGSWVCLTAVGDGRMVVSDQFGGLFVVRPDEHGATVERLPLALGMAQGLAVVGGDLYVVVNGSGGSKSGLYRAGDTDGDGRWDTAELLRAFHGKGEHGPHAVISSPDGKSLFLSCGNVTPVTEFDASRVPRVWQEDVLLPTIDDPLRMFSHLRSPGGWVARTDLDGEHWELFAIGFRNQYDIAFDSNGELFTFDADNEYDIDTPWYRPTRVCHVPSGAEFGWRHGSGKWPTYYPDSVPPTVEVGPGSPTGVTFGYGARYPEKYQRALFAADWSHGRVFAVHLAPDGGSFTGTLEPFLSGSPLPVTDLAVNPVDSALYLTTGGRRVASALWRVVYEGEEPIRDAAYGAQEMAPEAATRRKLDSWHTTPAQEFSTNLAVAWSMLGHSDRAIRYAARTAIELQPHATWRERVLAETSPDRRPYALLAAVRCCDGEGLAGLYDAMRDTNLSELSTDGMLAFVRAVTLSHIRFDPPELATRRAIIAALLAQFPSGDDRLDHELASLLLAVQCEEAVPRTLELLGSAPLATDRMYYCHALTQAEVGWTEERRRAYYRALHALLAFSQGRSMQAYAERLAALADTRLDDASRAQIADLIALRKQLAEDQPTLPERPFVRRWELHEVAGIADRAPSEFDAPRGKRLFAEAQCFQCHRFAGRGGAVGPDLSAIGRRFSAEDLARALVEPNATVSDQYRQTAYTVDGKTIVGRIVNLEKDKVSIATDFTDPKNYLTVRTEDIEEAEPVANSPMPAGLLDVLNEQELRDLLGYLRAGE